MDKLSKYLEYAGSGRVSGGTFDSREALDAAFSTPLNYSPDHYRQKLQIFCPYFMRLAATYESPRVAELLCGNGTFLDLARTDLPGCATHYVNGSPNSVGLFRHLYGQEPPHELVTDLSAGEYDVVVSDASLNLMDEDQAARLVSVAPERVARGGALCLLVNLSPAEMRDGFDLIDTHRRLSLSMTCVYGMNTFCSVWLKN
jgi:hypothetical protein